MTINYSMIRNFLKRSQCTYDDHQIEVTYHCMKLLFQAKRPEPYEATLEDFAEYINTMYPDHVLFYKCYIHPNICPIILYLVVERLQNKELTATPRQIHGLCYQAQERLKDGLVQDETHAANYVIKIYQSGEWNEPYDFEIVFPEYQKKLRELHEAKKHAEE